LEVGTGTNNQWPSIPASGRKRIALFDPELAKEEEERVAIVRIGPTSG